MKDLPILTEPDQAQLRSFVREGSDRGHFFGCNRSDLCRSPYTPDPHLRARPNGLLARRRRELRIRSKRAMGQAIGIAVDEPAVESWVQRARTWAAHTAVAFPEICIDCRRAHRIEDPSAVPLCPVCALGQTNLDDESRSRFPDGSSAVAAYDGPLARAIASLKFHGELAMAGPLGRLMASSPVLTETWDLLVPVPLHAVRAWARGHNQSELLARWTLVHARRRALEPLPELALRLLKRTRATPPQRCLRAEARRQNLRGAFAVVQPERVLDRRVLIVDDVLTTGSTLMECVRVVRAAGARHAEGLALAWSQSDEG